MSSKPVVAIGWDVGGWRGTRQGFAAVTQTTNGQLRAHCLGRARGMSDWPEAAQFEAVVAFASGGLATSETHRVVMGIDAPFGFPSAFRRLIDAASTREFDKGSIVSNPYAFRRTDLSIYKRFKMPLSAAFDKLGNNATVAMHYLALWRAAGVKVLPFERDDGESPVAIEVYPAVAGPQADAPPSWLRAIQHESGDLANDAHQRDALISAGLAMAYASPGLAGLPTLAPPDEPLPDGEGWIYAPEGGWPKART